ncbi:hypothetical protein KIPB_005138 [Kipferlia bialata]|uniref:Uncharacterized protein n=1 Tax=Kipferlia bialata TaxID=797122 RepID=A0A9K3CWS5_9EUKA|nr:hypothetical protein KIPB_005138 [Kipferlia bialata]|eukprot:g5138.t1
MGGSSSSEHSTHHESKHKHKHHKEKEKHKKHHKGHKHHAPTPDAGIGSRDTPQSEMENEAFREAYQTDSLGNQSRAMADELQSVAMSPMGPAPHPHPAPVTHRKGASRLVMEENAWRTPGGSQGEEVDELSPCEM